MRILGIDIGNGVATCCLLDHLPADPRQLNTDGANFQTFNADVEGIKSIRKIHPDIAILEPTGMNYSKLWCNVLAQDGVEVRLVAHSKLAAHRTVVGLPDKDDESDSLALAHYGWMYKDLPERFVRIRDEKISILKRDSLRIQHLNRLKNPIVNRMKQDLAWQLPELSKRQIKLQGKTPPIMIRWLAGAVQSKRYDKMYAESVGLGLTSEVRDHARRLCDIYEELIQINERNDRAIAHPDYADLVKVFNAFGFGSKLQAALICQIHPFADFLGDDGAPIVQFSRGKESKKTTKKELSRRRFEKAIGCAPTRAQSGDKDKKQIVGGSNLTRKLLWQWVFGSCSVLKSRQANPIQMSLYQWMSHPKREAKPLRLLRMNTCSHTARILFKVLAAQKKQIIPNLLSSFPDDKGRCNSCGAQWKGSSCRNCDELKHRIESWYYSFTE